MLMRQLQLEIGLSAVPSYRLHLFVMLAMLAASLRDQLAANIEPRSSSRSSIRCRDDHNYFFPMNKLRRTS